MRSCRGSMPDSAADRRPYKPGGVSGTNPAHLLRGQRLHLHRVSPAACNLAPVSSQGAPAGTLHPAEQSSGKGAAGGAEPLTAVAVSLFGLSPDS